MVEEVGAEEESEEESEEEEEEEEPRRRSRNSQGRMIPQRQHAVLGAEVVVLLTSTDPVFVVVFVNVATVGGEGLQASISQALASMAFRSC